MWNWFIDVAMNRLTRTAYVDIAKGMAILSVVLLHVDFAYPQWPLLDISAMLGWYWHVPVFFLIGGFFLKDERLAQPVSFIKGKFRSLYLLALYIYLPATLLHNCLLWMGVVFDRCGLWRKSHGRLGRERVFVGHTQNVALCRTRTCLGGNVVYLCFALCLVRV